MIEFLKTLIKNITLKSKDETLNKYNKIIYSFIILCTLLFLGTLIYFIIKGAPNFLDSIRYSWNESKGILDSFKFTQQSFK